MPADVGKAITDERSETTTEVNTGAVTVSVVVDVSCPLRAETVAVIVVVPGAYVVARPVVEIVATEGSEELQVA